MTSTEIIYQLLECLATTQCMKRGMIGNDLVGMENMEERLIKLIEFFKLKYQEDTGWINNVIEKL